MMKIVFIKSLLEVEHFLFIFEALENEIALFIFEFSYLIVRAHIVIL